MSQTENTTWFRAFQRWRVLTIAAIFVVLEGLYFLSGAPEERALAVFVIAPLVVGAFGRWQTTAWTAVAAVAVTLVTWWVTSPVEGTALFGRLLVVTAGGVTAVFGARTREHQRDEAVALQVRMETAATFVDQLVPDLVALTHVDTLLHYEPGEAGLHVGGDFMDVVELADGSAAFVIGDVCGHGPRPAALGVALRNAWRAVVRLAPPDPARWLSELEATFGEELAESFVTACTGTVAPGGATGVLSSAGHPYPIVLGPRPVLATMANDPPLGLRVADRIDHEVELDGCALLLFTDGLWESTRIGSDGTRAPIEAVVDAVAAVGSIDGPHALERMVDALRPGDGTFDDDVAVLVIRPR